jgi:flagellar protein FliO/FliZ
MNYAPEMTTTALKMLLSLGIVLALVWGLYRLARRNLPGIQAGPRGKLIRVLASHYLGVKKSIAVVQVPGAILVLGIGAEQVNLLSRIDDPAAVAEFQRNEVKDNKPSFRNQLQRMLRPGSET